MRGHMDPAEYKHVVLGLIFLKYISDAFEERHSWLVKQVSDPPSEYYTANLINNAKQPTIGKLVDDAMVAIEKENSSLKECFQKTMPVRLWINILLANSLI